MKVSVQEVKPAFVPFDLIFRVETEDEAQRLHFMCNTGPTIEFSVGHNAADSARALIKSKCPAAYTDGVHYVLLGKFKSRVQGIL